MAGWEELNGSLLFSFLFLFPSSFSSENANLYGIVEMDSFFEERLQACFSLLHGTSLYEYVFSMRISHGMNFTVTLAWICCLVDCFARIFCFWSKPYLTCKLLFVRVTVLCSLRQCLTLLAEYLYDKWSRSLLSHFCFNFAVAAQTGGQITGHLYANCCFEYFLYCTQNGVTLHALSTSWESTSLIVRL